MSAGSWDITKSASDISVSCISDCSSLDENDHWLTWLLVSVELLLSESDILSTDSEWLSEDILGLGGFCLVDERWDGLLVSRLSESSSDEMLGSFCSFCFVEERWDDLLITRLSESSSDDMLGGFGGFTFVALCLGFFFFGPDYRTKNQHQHNHSRMTAYSLHSELLTA